MRIHTCGDGRFPESLRVLLHLTVPCFARVHRLGSLCTCTFPHMPAPSGCIAVVFTKNGLAADLLSKYRPPCPIIVVSNSDAVLRGCTARYGLYPLKLEAVVSDVVMVRAEPCQRAFTGTGTVLVLVLYCNVLC